MKKIMETNDWDIEWDQEANAHMDRDLYAIKSAKWSEVKERIQPFRLLPNVSAINVVTSELDPLFESYGISKAKTKAKLTIKPANNKPINRYIIFTLKYLKTLDTKAYWKMVDSLLKNSDVFYVTALHRIRPTWARRNPLWYIIKQIKLSKRIARTELLPVKSKRLYISKSNGKSRPTAAPDLCWKMYLHLLNNFLAYRLSEKIDKSQHGFVSGRGTMTAWKEIIEKASKAEDIYEIDLKGAFDSITLKHIAKTLAKHKVPKEYISKIIMVSLSPINMPETEELKKITGEVGVHYIKNRNIKDFDEKNYRWELFWRTIVKVSKSIGLTTRDINRLMVKGSSNFWNGKKTFWKDLEIKRIKKVANQWKQSTKNVIGNKTRIGIMENSAGKRSIVYAYREERCKWIRTKWRRIIEYDWEDNSEKIYTRILWKKVRKLSKSKRSYRKGNLTLRKPVRILELGLPGRPNMKEVTYRNHMGKTIRIRGKIQELRDYFKMEILESLNKYERGRVGVPQGFPTSPFIFALCVNDLFFGGKNTFKCTAYADDALFWGKIKDENEIKERTKEETGLEYNEEKCGWVKRKGKWLKPLKFLGMTWEPSTDKIKWSSSTRSGTQLEFDKSFLVKLYTEGTQYTEIKEDDVQIYNIEVPRTEWVAIEEAFRVSSFHWETQLFTRYIKRQIPGWEVKQKATQEQVKELLSESDILDQLAGSDLLGYIQSRMYIGSWNYDIRQDFKLSFDKGSWIAEQKKVNYHFNIFNSSSYAIEGLLNNTKGKANKHLKNFPRMYDWSDGNRYRYPEWWTRRNIYFDGEHPRYALRFDSFFQFPRIIRKKSYMKRESHLSRTKK